MRLSTVFELLVIALLIAFAASRVIDGRDVTRTLVKDHRFAIHKDKERKDRQSVNPQTPPSRYCSCSSLTCNCCREFSLPIVPIKGPGCATVSYLHDDAMMVTMSFGERVLRNITINSKKPKPICMGMPGGISKFCGRLYSIKKEGENFKACLGLELRALDDVEAALRVSCFKFGPHGVNVEPGEAVPVDKVKEEDEDDEDDYGFGDLDDDDDDDDDDFGLTGGEDDDYDDDDDDDDEKPPAKDTYNDVDSSDSDADADYTGLSSLSEEIFGGFFGSSSKKKKPIINNDDSGTYYVPEPPKIQPPTQSQQPTPQVNLVVMHPVIIPQTQSVLQQRPSVQKKPLRKRVNSTSPAPVKRVRPTTVAPVKKIRTTPVPVKTLTTSTVPSVTQATNATAKPPVKKKKKKPARTRRPTTQKPNTTFSTETTPMVVTETTITVNVMQGGINLNETKPQTVQKPVKVVPLKIPMSKPVIETKPVDPIKQYDEGMVTNIDKNVSNVSQEKESEQINPGTEKVNTDSYELTTQTIMQNTIPIDESIDDKLYYNMNAQKLPLNKPLEQQNDDILFEDMMLISTTPYNENNVEDTTNQETTAQEVTSYINNSFDTSLKNSGASISSFESVTAENDTELNYEMTTTASTNELKKEDLKNDGTETIISEYIAETQAMSSATESYYLMDEGTDKTETITKSSNKEDSQENYSDEDENDDDDEDGIDLEADLGLEDDEDEEEEGSSKNNSELNLKAEEKDDDDDDDDVLGGLLDDDDEEEEDDSKSKEKERTLGNNVPYQINPLLYRLARISSGSVATARHLPRFSEGRNRRNNKRMRFPPLEITP